MEYKKLFNEVSAYNKGMNVAENAVASEGVKKIERIGSPQRSTGSGTMPVIERRRKIPPNIMISESERLLIKFVEGPMTAP